MATTRRKARGYVDPQMYVADVESITLRETSGAGEQAELFIKTRTGVLAIRLIARKGVAFRFSDMRANDRKRRRRVFLEGQEARAALVPLKDIEAHPTRSLRARDYVGPRSSVEAEEQAIAAEAYRDAQEDR